MSARRIVAMVLVLSVLSSGPGLVSRTGAQPAPVVAPPPPAEAQAPAPSADVTPARVSYSNGEVSFWRPGAQDWTPATLNTPLAPGDVLYAGRGGNVEIQVGPLAFVRATNGTQIGLDNQEPGFVQLRVTGGEAAVDVRQLPPGSTIEVDTPNAAFTIDRAGYYRAVVAQYSATCTTPRGGSATRTPAGGAAAPIGADQQVVSTGTDSPQVAIGAAPQLTAWDTWNYQRTDYLLQPANTQYVSASMYGTETLAQHGTWRTVESYGPVWVPASVPPGWVPYSTGRWIWDPRFGWTWLDDAPWGWAPYHHGRWVFAGSYWAWAPGPIVVRPVYAPALVVFLGGGVRVGVRPLCWAPLAWGEPIIPWWGRPGFVGVATWRGWGGPHVVNNVVVNRTTTVNVTNINVYRNVTVNNAVVGVSADRFGHHERPRRIEQAEVRQLAPVRGALDVKPVAASVTVASGAAAKPPAAIEKRAVVATRPPHDVTTRLRDQGIAPTRTAEPDAPPRIVPAPRPVRGTEPASTRPQPSGPRNAPAPRADVPEGRGERPDRDQRRERNQPQAMPAPSQTPTSSQTPTPPRTPAPSQTQAPSRTPAPPQAPGQSQTPAQSQAPAPQRQPAAPRSDPAAKGGERPERDDRRARSQPQNHPAPPHPPSPARQP